MTQSTWRSFVHPIASSVTLLADERHTLSQSNQRILIRQKVCRAEIWEGDEPQRTSSFGVRRFTEWPELLECGFLSHKFQLPNLPLFTLKIVLRLPCTGSLYITLMYSCLVQCTLWHPFPQGNECLA